MQANRAWIDRLMHGICHARNMACMQACVNTDIVEVCVIADIGKRKRHVHHCVTTFKKLCCCGRRSACIGVLQCSVYVRFFSGANRTMTRNLGALVGGAMASHHHYYHHQRIHMDHHHGYCNYRFYFFMLGMMITAAASWYSW